MDIRRDSSHVSNYEFRITNYERKRIVAVVLFVLLICFPGFSNFAIGQEKSKIVDCLYRIKSVLNVNLGGIDVRFASSLDKLGKKDAETLTTASRSGSLPVSFTLNLQVKNPNHVPAGLKRVEWVLFIDGIRMSGGTLDWDFRIPPHGGSALIPLTMRLDLAKLLKGKSPEEMVNFGLAIPAKTGDASRFILKIKPSVHFGEDLMTPQDFIVVGTTYPSH